MDGAEPVMRRMVRPEGRACAVRRAATFVLGGLLGLVFAGYAIVWAVPSVHRLVAESVLTSGHQSWAWLFATAAERRAWGYAFTHTPAIDAVTHLTSAAPTHPARSQSGQPRARSCVSVSSVTGPEYRGWVLRVCQPAWIHVAVTPRLGTVGEQTSMLAQGAGAVAAVNGGGFVDPGGEGTGGQPQGITVSGGRTLVEPVPDNSYYVIGFDGSGRLAAGKWSAPQVRALGIREAVSFKPLLIVDGKPLITHGDGGWGIAPRAAIAQRANGTVLFAVIDGRQPGSLGATLRQVQDLLLREGAVTAANLDGGSSATLWYHGHVINHPCCSPNGQRFIPTAWVIKPRPQAQ